MTAPSEILVYRTRSCPFCVAAEQLLRSRGAVFEEVFLDDHPDRRAATAAILPGHYTVPLVVIDGEPLGGFTELQKLDAQGGLSA